MEVINTNVYITDNDYKTVLPQIKLLFNSLSQMSTCGYYVVDCFRCNYLYVSENMEYWCGHSANEIMTLGSSIYSQCVPPEDLDIMEEIHAAAFHQINLFLEKERCNCLLSYDFHFVINGEKMMVNKRMIPFLQKDGKIWLILCKITLSNSKTAGNAILRNNFTNTFYEYCFSKKQWILKLLPTLSDNEKAILRLMAQGMSNKEIAEQLCYSEQTIKTYRKYLNNKLQTNNASELIMYVVNNGLFLL